MTTEKNRNNAAIAAAGLLTAVIFLSMFAQLANVSAAYSETGRPVWAKNPHTPAGGAIGIANNLSTAQGCNLATSTADSTKGGEYFRFIVPSTISTIQNSGHPEQNVNLHAAWMGSDGFYREVGLYYGNWRNAPGSGYNPNVFQFAYGRADASGGMLRGVIPLPVVAGHTVELYFTYSSRLGQWQILYDDLNDGNTIGTITEETSTINVKSNYWLFIEDDGLAAPNANAQALGLVEILNVSEATKIAGDGVSLATWAHGYEDTSCQPGNQNYGITYLSSAGHFKIGYGGATKTSGFQFW